MLKHVSEFPSFLRLNNIPVLFEGIVFKFSFAFLAGRFRRLESSLGEARGPLGHGASVLGSVRSVLPLLRGSLVAPLLLTWVSLSGRR